MATQVVDTVSAVLGDIYRLAPRRLLVIFGAPVAYDILARHGGDVYGHHHFHLSSGTINALAGAYAGVLSTVPMTAAVALMKILLPASKEDLEVERAEDQNERRLEHDDKDTRQTGDMPWWKRTIARIRASRRLVMRYGIGMLAGAIYGYTVSHYPELRSGRAGVVWGLGVWLLDHGVFLPAIGIRHKTTHRMLVSALAHIVWGWALTSSTVGAQIYATETHFVRAPMKVFTISHVPSRVLSAY